MEADIREVMRYLGAGKGDDSLFAAAQAIACEIKEVPRYTYRVFHLKGLSLPELGLALTGNTASKMLDGCEKVVLLACTLGLEFDARLRAAQARDMSKAVILDGCGSALVEQGCEEAEREIALRFPGMYLTDRFSPGYGDLPLSLQPQILQALDAQRRRKRPAHAPALPGVGAGTGPQHNQHERKQLQLNHGFSRPCARSAWRQRR